MTTKKAQVETFYAQGDFGYVRDQRKEMSIFCEPLFVVSFMDTIPTVLQFLFLVTSIDSRMTRLWNARNT